jgi:hypothetical protein
MENNEQFPVHVKLAMRSNVGPNGEEYDQNGNVILQEGEKASDYIPIEQRWMSYEDAKKQNEQRYGK